jgi:hypothetical protein
MIWILSHQYRNGLIKTPESIFWCYFHILCYIFYMSFEKLYNVTPHKSWVYQDRPLKNVFFETIFDMNFWFAFTYSKDKIKHKNTSLIIFQFWRKLQLKLQIINHLISIYQKYDRIQERSKKSFPNLTKKKVWFILNFPSIHLRKMYWT